MRIKDFVKYLDINTRICIETEYEETLYQGRVRDINIALFEDFEITDMMKLVISGGTEYLALDVKKDDKEKLFKTVKMHVLMMEEYKEMYMTDIEELKKQNLYEQYLDWLREGD